MESSSLPLHLCRPQKLSATINRLYFLLYIIALLGHFYYRTCSFLQTTPPSKLHILVFASELLLSLLWLFHQAYLWRPVSRKIFPEGLPENKLLPAIDVFICTADPKKEPPLERKYKLFEEDIKRAEESVVIKETDCKRGQNHPSIVEVINDADEGTNQQVQMPLLVYVSHEKTPFHPHHFKAGAFNVLLRVSSIISNSPYILALDCDMYCNDPISARQAMCFHLDTKISPSLAFVQFPQKFHTITKSDIYDSHLRTTCVRNGFFDSVSDKMARYGWTSGTNVVWNRLLHEERSIIWECFAERYAKSPNKKAFYSDLIMLAIFNLYSSYQKETANFVVLIMLSNKLYCLHDQDQIGFLYNSMVEDYFTGFLWHCKGWNSVLCNPSRPAFLGTATTKLNDTLVQAPLFAALMVFSYRASALSLEWHSNISQEEVLITGGSVLTWWNEQRFWMIKSITTYTYGILDTILKHCANLLTPLVTLVILNMISYAGGIARMVIQRSWDEMFGQVFLSFYILLVNYPVIEGMTSRKDKARIPPSVALLSLSLHCILVTVFEGSQV
ncbi:hypothetical protein QYF36_026982 [Acer negundo]|nr:hypothetical protein QYF36_026982 [Acer negundo]